MKIDLNHLDNPPPARPRPSRADIVAVVAIVLGLGATALVVLMGALR